MNDFHSTTKTAAGAPLIAHLRGDLFLPGEVTQVARLVNRVRQRFLHVGVLAHLHRHGGGERVMVVWRGNDDRVDVPADFVEHFAIVAEKFCLRICLLAPV